MKTQMSFSSSQERRERSAEKIPELEMLDQPRYTKPTLQISILFPLEAHSKTYYFIFDGLPTSFLTPSQSSFFIFSSCCLNNLHPTQVT